MKLGIKVDVPDRLAKFLRNPTPFFTSTLKEADRQALTMLKTDISRAAPKRSGKLASSFVVNTAQRSLYSKLVYARAVELGHYAEPRNTPKRMFLKFTSQGKEVFLRYVRTRKSPFFFITAHRDKAKLIDIYDVAFKKMLEKV